MACLNVSNGDQQHQGSFYNSMTTPRISFSNDFLDPQQPIKFYREAPVSSDFEFSVRNYSMISADEVFFNGRMLPSTKTTTLRDELLAGDDDNDNDNDNEEVSSLRVAKGGMRRWKERLGLKRSQTQKGVDVLGRIDEVKASDMVCGDVFAEGRLGEKTKAFNL